MGRTCGERDSERGGAGAVTGLLPAETATGEPGPQRREGDKVQAGKPQCEQGGTERETDTRREQRGIVAETENV